MAIFTVVNISDLPFDDFTRYYILPNGARVDEETIRFRLRFNPTGKSELFLDYKQENK